MSSRKATTITFPDLNLADADAALCVLALTSADTIVGAAKLLGITRHALARRIIKHRIDWPRFPRPEETQ